MRSAIGAATVEWRLAIGCRVGYVEVAQAILPAQAVIKGDVEDDRDSGCG